MKEGHTKGHQNKRGKIIGTGPYSASFTWDSFGDEWLQLLKEHVQRIHEAISTKMLQNNRSNEKKEASLLHKETMRDFYHRLGGAVRFTSHSACFCCLREMPEHPLPCGHVLCTPCVRAYGWVKRGSVVQVDSCPMHYDQTPFPTPWILKFKPDFAGVRILSLDGYYCSILQKSYDMLMFNSGGIRGIVELEVLREIERSLGDKIPIQNFFDLIVGTRCVKILLYES
jgi:hypothetical protein